MSETDDQRETRKHNAAVRNDMMREAHQKLIALEAKKSEIQADIRKVRKTLKGDVGISLKYFDAMRHLVELEDDEYGKAQDDLRESFNALSDREQLDWVVATNQDSAAA